jgi:hypothetical protein
MDDFITVSESQDGEIAAMRVSVLPPEIWKQICLYESPGPRFDHVLHYLHERHIGITPKLAMDLVRIAEGDGGPIWGAALDRLSEALVGNQNPSNRSVALWRAVPIFTLTSRLAAPLLRHACDAVGMTILFGQFAENSDDPPTKKNDYEVYEHNLVRALAILSTRPDVMGTRFWRDCAETMLGAARRIAGHDVASGPFGRPAGLPDVDQVLLSFLTELNPAFSPTGERRSPLYRRITRSQTDRSGVKPKEGGVEGVRFSRSLEDVGDLVASEYLSPKVILADKILNQGFIARHRPPLRRPRRDALIVGIMSNPDRSDADRFVKAGWLNSIFRTSIILRQAGYGRTEFRWLERSGRVGYRSARVDLQGITLPDGNSPWDHEGNAVLGFLRQAQWTPTVLDRLASNILSVHSEQNTAGFTSENEEGSLDETRLWIRRAFEQSWLDGVPPPLESIQLSGLVDIETKREPAPTTLDDFASVHVQVFSRDPSRSHEMFEPDWIRERVRLSAALKFSGRYARNVDLCLIPHYPHQIPIRIWSRTGRNAGVTSFETTEFNDKDVLERRYAELIEDFVGRALNTVFGA